MSHRLSVALGDRRSAALARSPLADAIQAGLHGTPVRRGASRRAAPLLASALALSLAPALAHSAVITVDSAIGVATPGDGLCQLPEAIANANDGAVEADCAAGDEGLDSIVFDPTLADSTIELGAVLPVFEPLEMDGAAAPGLLIASTGGIRLIDAQADLAVSNLALANGNAGIGSGGAIAAGSALSVDNVDFLGNSAKYGGAINAIGPLEVTDSYFAGNTAAGKYMADGSQSGSGGAISSYLSPTITGSSFVGNTAAHAGGAVHAIRGAAIAGSTFADNQAKFGGAVMSGDGPLAGPPEPAPQGVPAGAAVVLDIGDSTFLGNIASVADAETDPALAPMGGAVAFLPQGSVDGSVAHALTITGSGFSGNAAIPPGDGGGVRGGKYQGDLSVGGALAATLVAGSDAPRDPLGVEISDSLFDNNFAALGGAASVNASSITVDGSTFSDNVAVIAGGASLGAKYGKYDEDLVLALADTTFSDNAAILAGGAILGGTEVQASGLTVTGNVAGTSTGSNPYSLSCESGFGKYGGVLVAGGTVTLTGANLVDGNCAGNGGGLSVYAAAGSIGPGTVVSNNQALAADGMGGGLMLRSNGMLVDGARVSGNSSAGGGGGVVAIGAVTLANSTLSGNTAGMGAGLYAAVPDNPPTAKGSAATQLTLLNTTIHGNTATAPQVAPTGTVTAPPGTGGGIAIGSGVVLDGRFATITGNGASDAGGGTWLDPAATASLSDSIVAGNTAPTGADIAGAITARYTLVQDPAGATLLGAGTGNQTGLDPLLGPLQDNGGPTPTRLPLAGSPVIDSGDPGFAPPPTFDQRGPGFPRLANGVVDKGAVEVPAPQPQVISLAMAPPTVVEGSSASITVGLDGSAPADVYVTLDFGGAATAGVDYTVSDADPVADGVQVLVAAGASEGSATLQAILDGVNEPDESVTATVAGVVGADLPAPLSTSGTIVDGDGMPMATLSLGQATILEEGGSTTITVTLSVPSSQDVTITLGFSGTATFGTDYTVSATQIVIPAGQTSGSVVLNAIDDADDEGDETVVVDILSVSNGLEAGVQQATIVIDGTADGVAPAPGPGANPQPAIIPTLSEWMLMLLGLLLPATVVARLRRAEAPARRR